MRVTPVSCPRAHKAGDEPSTHWIDCSAKDDWNRPRRLLCSPSRWHTSCRDDDVDRGMNQLRGKARKPFVFPLGPPVLDRDVLTFHVAELAEC
jgi:hypothetical protein